MTETSICAVDCTVIKLSEQYVRKLLNLPTNKPSKMDNSPLPNPQDPQDVNVDLEDDIFPSMEVRWATYYNYSLMSVTSILIINIVTCLGKTTNYNVLTETNDATSHVQSQQCIPQTTGAKSKEVSWWNESCPTSSAGGHLHWCGPGSIFSPIYIYDRNKHLCCWLYCHQTFWAICSKAIEFTHQQTEQNG